MVKRLKKGMKNKIKYFQTSRKFLQQKSLIFSSTHKEQIIQLKQNNLMLLIFLLILSLVTGCAHNQPQLTDHAPWKFALISDTQGANRPGTEHRTYINEPVVKAIAFDIAKEKPDFVLVAGDLVSGWSNGTGIDYVEQYKKWRSAMEPVYRSNIPVFPIRGNHDVGPERVALPPLPARMEPQPGALATLEQSFKESFNDSYIPWSGSDNRERFNFSFGHKNVFIVGLDVCGKHQHKVDQDWLNKQISKNISPHIFVFAHEPAFQVRHKDCLAFYEKDRDLFWDTLGKAGNRVFFCGHDHLYNRAVIEDSMGNQIRQIVAGTGGGRLAKWSGTYIEHLRIKGEYNNSNHHGYIIVVVDGKHATIIWKALVMQESGNSWIIPDTFSYTLLDGL